MAYQRDTNPLSGSYTNFWTYIPTIATFLTTNGWTVHEQRSVSASDYRLLASKNAVGLKLTYGTASVAHCYAGTGWTAGTDLDNQQPDYGYYYIARYIDNDNDLVMISIDDEFGLFMIDTGPADEVTAANEITMASGTGAVWGIFDKPGPYSGGQFCLTSYSGGYPLLSGSASGLSVLTGETGHTGTSPNMWSGGRAYYNVEYGCISDEVTGLYGNSGQPKVNNLSVIVHPIMYYRRGIPTTICHPVGIAKIIVSMDTLDLYKAGDIIDYGTEQYMAASTASTIVQFGLRVA